MDTSNIWGSAPSWMSRTRNWLSERARLRRDAEVVSRMDFRELKDLGISHTAAVGSGIVLTECGSIANRSWIHAQPCFPRRAIRHD